ncbi:MAG TPA: GNAT family N-acetyltransferase [Nitrolancea sp.]|nr:GNAT family N-acetyltransferase [Nitrolancea sp.]
MRETSNLIRIDPLADPLWARLVEREHGSLFHSDLWLQVLHQTYQMDVQANLLLDDTGEPEAGLHFVAISDIRGERIVSLPFSDYCDPLVSNDAQWSELVEPLLASRQPMNMRCLHNEIPLLDDQFEHAKRAKWHGIDLEDDVEAIWPRIENSARRAIRKAEKSGIVTRLARDERDLRAFFRLHLGIRKYKYRLLAQPYGFFQNIWQIFSNAGRAALMLAVADDEVIGSVMFLGWGSTLYYKFSASSAAHLEYRPTDLLIWEGIKYAKAQGYEFLDLGLSDWDQDGLVRYKRKFATSEKTITFLQHTVDRPISVQEQAVPKLLSTFTDLMTDPSVPDAVTERAGDAIYRYFV